jgi:fatty-acyl-CoA synthase
MREVVVAYGLSEASPNVGMSAWWDAEEDRVNGLLWPQPGIEVEIRDRDTGTACTPDTVGEIVVRGWSVMRGYFDKPDETEATVDSEGWLKTGDLGRMTGDGRLVFVGRAKDIIRVGGENVAPADVENTLHRHPKILQAQAIGVPDRRLVEVVAAFVTLNPGSSADPDEIIAWCAERMAGFKVPRYVRVVQSFEEIGMTASSKVQKNRLVEHAIRLLGLDDVESR